MSIIYYPSTTLSTPCTEVDFTTVSKLQLEELYNNLCKHMIEYEGIGIAANQIGVSHKVCVIYSENQVNNNFLLLINPEILRHGKDTMEVQEGCLSFPGLNINRIRPKIVTIKYQNIEGEKKEITLKGIDSICIQHEVDHLNGISFIDDLDVNYKDSIKDKLDKLKNM